MMKYIDAEGLLKEIKRLERAAHKSALDCADSETRKFHEGKALAYQFAGILIDSFQQKQPEVELEKEFKEYVDDDPVYSKLVNHFAGMSIARHFYELGLNVRKEE